MREEEGSHIERRILDAEEGSHIERRILDAEEGSQRRAAWGGYYCAHEVKKESVCAAGIHTSGIHRDPTSGILSYRLQLTQGGEPSSTPADARGIIQFDSS